MSRLMLMNMIIAICILRSLQGSGSGYTMNVKHNTQDY